MAKKIILLAVVLFFLPFSAAFAQTDDAAAGGDEPHLSADTAKSSSGLPVPRFVTLAADKVFVRTGPALRYPIKWVYQRQRLPVEVVQEFDTWRKIRDMDGDDGWVHSSLLSGDRSVIVKGEANLSIRREAEPDSRVLAHLEPNVIAAVLQCKAAWCEVRADGYKGYAERKFLWGIYDSEDFD
jgi:SH3-like domain-containing protein